MADIPGSEFEKIKSVVSRALTLNEEADRARAAKDEETAARIYEELLTVLAPRAKALIASTVEHKAFAHFAYGVTLRVLHLYGDAIVELKHALELAPAAVDILIEITLCLGQEGHAIEAEPYAQRAVELAPRSAGAWGNLAMTLIQNKKREQAFDAITKAVALDPSDTKNRYILEHFHRYF